MEAEGGWLKSVKHVASREKVQPSDGHIRISTRFHPTGNHLDHTYCAVLQPTAYTPCDLFPADAAFKRTMCANGIKAISDLFATLANELRKEEEAKSLAIIAPDALIQGELQKNRSAENLAKV